MSNEPILVIGATGKTGSRVATKLEAKGVFVRRGARRSDTPFDWDDQSTWPPILTGVSKAYVTYFPDLAFPGAVEKLEAFTKVAADSGLKVDFSKIERTPNTLDAHRLIRWAKTTGMQNALSQQLFVRYFEQGQDISDHTVLLDAAESVGMEREVVKSLLESDADKQMLLDEEATAREIGVSGVPCFIVGGKYVVQGAQPPETWVKVIRELVEAEAAQAKEQAGGVAGAQQP